jgi:hypothetical protein
MIPRTLLIASGAFDGLSAQRVVEAVSRGLAAEGWPTDPFPLEDECELAADVRGGLDALDFDTRLRSARAVVLGERRLAERTLAGSVTFEIASRARQAGVPAHAVTARNRLDAFDARILDLQLILEASSGAALERAGRRLAELV